MPQVSYIVCTRFFISLQNMGLLGKPIMDFKTPIALFVTIRKPDDLSWLEEANIDEGSDEFSGY